MQTPLITAKSAEKKPPVRARKRRQARELERFAFREICDQFEIRGADSDIDLAEAFETQRPSVMSILVHHLFQRVRKIEARRATEPSRVVEFSRKGAAA